MPHPRAVIAVEVSKKSYQQHRNCHTCKERPLAFLIFVHLLRNCVKHCSQDSYFPRNIRIGNNNNIIVTLLKIAMQVAQCAAHIDVCIVNYYSLRMWQFRKYFGSEGLVVNQNSVSATSFRCFAFIWGLQ